MITNDRERDVLELCKKVIDVMPNSSYHSNGPDETSCPFCGAFVHYAEASMEEIKHDSLCAYLLAKDLSTNLI